MEAPDGYCASNGQCSPGKENSRLLADVSTPNGQTVPQGPNSPSGECSIRGNTFLQSANNDHKLKIKQEEEKADEADNRSQALKEISQTGEEGAALEESMSVSPSNVQDGLSEPNMTADAGSRQPHGDRPFQCNQCGVSFTQKGNLLRHIKLHTGEKPFKCPFCSYACRRRDALSGHLRTHAVGKPHKCNYCGRSYKQRTSLEEHKERCHSYLQGIGLDPNANTGPYTVEVPKESRPMAEPNTMATIDRPPVIERLQSNVGKRKSTTPQKFVGEKIRYSYPELGYEMGLKYEKQAEMMSAHMMDQAISNAITYLGSDTIRPMLHHPSPPLSMAEVVPMINPLFHHVLPLGQRTDHPGNCDTLPPQPPQPHDPSHPTTNGPTALTRQGKLRHPGQEESPSNSGVDSADSARSSPHERQSNHGSNPIPAIRFRASPAMVYSGERVTEALPRSGAGMGTAITRVATERPVSQEGVRVFGRDGREVRAFQCEHCQVLFLDHVMYTIHMGCHGYRDPLECNICGHRSKDSYEFSSHIVRGEHTFQ